MSSAGSLRPFEDTVPKFNSALNAWASRVKYTTARPIASSFPRHGNMDDLTTERRFDSQASWVIDVPGMVFDMVCMDFCTTRQWLTAGRLVQELNVRTVAKE